MTREPRSECSPAPAAADIPAVPDAKPAPGDAIVIALGGNAISPPTHEGTITRQFEQTRASAAALVDVIAGDRPVVITHGNGPQVGSAVRRVELSAHEVYDLPLSICVADLQGGMGYMISQCLNDELESRSLPQRVAAIVTRVEVDPNDPAFALPTKPIGPHYERARAARMQAIGWQMVEMPPHGWRRVVPSPRPVRILEIDLIRRLVDQGVPVIAAGGGGVPVVRDGDGRFQGREAVIDKDLASALLAEQIGAARLLIVTGEDRVCLEFGTPSQRPLDELSTADARRHLASGQFPPGSMGPKIQAAIDFLDRSTNPGAEVIISDIDHMSAALRGVAGTRITR
ncbi:MAG: carbamate kinase [Phycisphaerales bacterium]|nr:carbamate kinase [Phycisphaerales bacterium]